jgi:hypothetical protein
MCDWDSAILTGAKGNISLYLCLFRTKDGMEHVPITIPSLTAIPVV